MSKEIYNKFKAKFPKSAFLPQLENIDVNKSYAAQTIKALSNASEEVRNSTESRMTLYTSEITPYLHPDTSFVKRSYNDAQFAASGIKKRLNHATEGPTVTKGRVYGLGLVTGDNAPTQTVKVRKNRGSEVEIEYFHTTPTSISFELTSEVMYDARQEMLKAHADVLNQSIGQYAAVTWAQGAVGEADTVATATGDARYVFTTGANRPNSVTGATGNVKAITLADLKNVRKMFDKQLILSQGGELVFLPTIEQYWDLFNIPEFVDYEKTGQVSKLINGEIGTILGITILRPVSRLDWNANVLYNQVVTGTNTALTKIEDTASSGANMYSAGMIWLTTQVARAEGSKIVFPWMNSPILMGDVYATEARFGAYKRRDDGKGVVMLVESPGA